MWVTSITRCVKFEFNGKSLHTKNDSEWKQVCQPVQGIIKTHSIFYFCFALLENSVWSLALLSERWKWKIRVMSLGWYEAILLCQWFSKKVFFQWSLCTDIRNMIETWILNFLCERGFVLCHGVFKCQDF